MKTLILFSILSTSLFAFSENEGNAMRHIIRTPTSEVTSPPDNGVKLKICPEYPEPIDIKGQTSPAAQSPQKEIKQTRVNINVSIYVRVTLFRF